MRSKFIKETLNSIELKLLVLDIAQICYFRNFPSFCIFIFISIYSESLIRGVRTNNGDLDQFKFENSHVMRHN